MASKIKNLILKNRILVIFFIVAFITNLLLISKYRVESVDEVWSLSFYYNYFYKHIATDVVFLSEGGQSGVQYFGKIQAIVYGLFFHIFGWTKFNAGFIGSIILLATSFIWFRISSMIWKNRNLALTIALSVLLFEPFVASANHPRAEIVILFLSSLSLLFLIKKQYFLSIFLCFIALESHPTGIISFLYPLGYFISRYSSFELNKRLFLSISFAIVLGILFYIGLHYSVLKDILGIFMQNTDTPWSNLFVQYFFEAKYLRHLPELMLIIFSLIYSLKKKIFQKEPLIAIYLVFFIVFCTFFPRPNMHYMSLVYIFPVILICFTFSKLNKTLLLQILLITLIIPQYLWLIVNNFDSNYSYKLSIINEITNEYADETVVGSPNEWYLFKERNFYPSSVSDVIPPQKSFLLIKENDFSNLDDSSLFKKYLKESCNSELLKIQEFSEEKYEIERVKCE